MSNIRTTLQRIGVSAAVLLLVCVPPVASYAETTSNGIESPSGVAAQTYSYNVDSGLWENAYYTWNPTTKETLPKKALEYTYNSQTGLWDSRVWEFHPSVNAYEQVTVSVGQPPAGAKTHGGPTPAPAPAPAPSPTPAPAPAPAPQPAQAATNTPDSSETAPTSIAPAIQGPAIAVDSSGGLSVTNSSGIVMDNTIKSDAQSGNALLQGNYTAGDAGTGNAAAIATIINMLQSTAGLDGSNLATFVRDIQGDVSGDLLIDPAAFAQPSAAVSELGSVDINTSQDSAIHNNIDLSATSGNATIDDNTHAGNATTGNADAVANVLNLINSVIAANQSFVGVVNIHGNYTGNILVPTDSLNALLASNSPNPTAAIGQPANGTQNTDVSAETNVVTDSTQSIANNIDLAAVSGSATQDDNTHTGNATTGDALTNLTILNLTGHQVTAANSLLVFVNVLGTWVGVIMDAPAGATSAAFTGGAAPTAQAAQLTQSSESETNINTTQNNAIVNNITANATSGNATVSRNFESGNATSGNATASANVVNVMNSAFSLSDWFGVLFINVFGSWIGNFGKAAPTIAANPDTPAANPAPAAVFSFVPAEDGGTGGVARVVRTAFTSDEAYEDFTEQVGEVLAAHDVAPKQSKKPIATQTTDGAGYNLSLLPLALGLTGLAAVGAERVRSVRHRYVR